MLLDALHQLVITQVTVAVLVNREEQLAQLVDVDVGVEYHRAKRDPLEFMTFVEVLDARGTELVVGAEAVVLQPGVAQDVFGGDAVVNSYDHLRDEVFSVVRHVVPGVTFRGVVALVDLRDDHAVLFIEEGRVPRQQDV